MSNGSYSLLVINGKEHRLEIGQGKAKVASHHTLAYTLRETLGLTGTKVSCDSGACGACTVLIDGVPVLSCLTLTVECDGKNITTIEGISETKRGVLDPVQEVFIKHNAFQCGFCTPGIIMSSKALFSKNPKPTEEDMKEALSGHFCRCISHYQVLSALKDLSSNGESKEEIANKGEYRYIGRALPRKDAFDIVTGKTVYASDFSIPGQLYGVVLPSPYAHALIKKIDKRKAEKIEGVRAILTYEDVSSEWKGGNPPVTLILDRKLRFVGDAVALVAADTRDIAEEATKLIEVEYEVLEPIVDTKKAMSPGAPLLYDEFSENTVTPGLAAWGPTCLTQLVMGDCEKGFSEADAVIEGSAYYKNIPNALAAEPPAIVAQWENPNSVIIWVSSQSPFRERELISKVFKDEVQIRTIGLPCGGSFGSKALAWRWHCFAILLSKATNKPVKMVMSKKEQLATFTLRPGCEMHAKVGIKKDGTVTAISGKSVIDTGYYSRTTQAQVAVGLGEIQLMLRCPNWNLKPKIICTNRTASGQIRGFGGQELKCVLMPILSKGLAELGIDPFEFLKKNFVKPGDSYYWRDGSLYTYRGIDYGPTLEKGARTFGWKEKWKGWLRPTEIKGKKRIGVGVCIHGNADIGEDASEALIRIQPNGTCVILACVSEFGTGQKSNYARMAAEVLGLPLRNVFFGPADSLVSPHVGPAGGSRGTYAIGSAIIKAAEDAKTKLLEFFASKMGVDPQELDTEKAEIFLKHSPYKRIHWKEMGSDRTIVGFGRFEPDYTLANCLMSFVEVEVDTETGFVNLVRVVNVTNAGKIMDPLGLEGQLNGCLGSAGIDTALWEETVIDKKSGHVLTSNLIDYKWRTFAELPSIENVVEETPFPSHRFYSIGIGEIATSPGPAAVAMAVSNAIGRWVEEYPITPDKILKLVNES